MNCRMTPAERRAYAAGLAARGTPFGREINRRLDALLRQSSEGKTEAERLNALALLVGIFGKADPAEMHF